MSASPEAALEALGALPGVLSLVAVNVRHAKEVDNSHGGQDRLLESQASKLDALGVEVNSMVRALTATHKEV
jgi:hypothetical protein